MLVLQLTVPKTNIQSASQKTKIQFTAARRVISPLFFNAVRRRSTTDRARPPRLDAVDVESNDGGSRSAGPPRQREHGVVAALAQPVVLVQRRIRRPLRRRRRQLLALALPWWPPLAPPHVHLRKHLPVLAGEQGRLAGRARRAGGGSAAPPARRPASGSRAAAAVVVADEPVEPHHQVQDARLRLCHGRVVERLDLERLRLHGRPPHQIVPCVCPLADPSESMVCSGCVVSDRDDPLQCFLHGGSGLGDRNLLKL